MSREHGVQGGDALGRVVHVEHDLPGGPPGQIVRGWLECAARCECPSLDECPLFGDPAALPQKAPGF